MLNTLQAHALLQLARALDVCRVAGLEVFADQWEHTCIGVVNGQVILDKQQDLTGCDIRAIVAVSEEVA